MMERLKMREFAGKQLSSYCDTVRPVYYQVLHGHSVCPGSQSQLTS